MVRLCSKAQNGREKHRRYPKISMPTSMLPVIPLHGFVLASTESTFLSPPFSSRGGLLTTISSSVSLQLCMVIVRWPSFEINYIACSHFPLSAPCLIPHALINDRASWIRRHSLLFISSFLQQSHIRMSPYAISTHSLLSYMIELVEISLTLPCNLLRSSSGSMLSKTK